MRVADREGYWSIRMWKTGMKRMKISDTLPGRESGRSQINPPHLVSLIPPHPPSVMWKIRSKRSPLIKAHFMDGRDGIYRRNGHCLTPPPPSFPPPASPPPFLLTPLGPRALCLPWEYWAKGRQRCVHDKGWVEGRSGGVHACCEFVHVCVFLVNSND